MNNETMNTTPAMEQQAGMMNDHQIQAEGTNGTPLNPQRQVARWQGAALAMDTSAIRQIFMPLSNYLEEADGVAFFFERYWNPSTPGVPSLNAVKGYLSNTLGEEVRSLVQACRMVQTKLLFPEPMDKSWTEIVERGRTIAGELSAALEFVLDDEILEDSDVALQGAWKREAENHSSTALAQTLSDYAGIAERNVDRLKQLEGFDLTLITQARVISARLTERGPQVRSGRPSSDLIDLRNRLLTLLEQRLSTIRKAVRFVFRQYPEIARQVGSEYNRRKRARSRQRKASDEPANEAVTSNDEILD